MAMLNHQRVTMINIRSTTEDQLGTTFLEFLVRPSFFIHFAKWPQVMTHSIFVFLWCFFWGSKRQRCVSSSSDGWTSRPSGEMSKVGISQIRQIRQIHWNSWLENSQRKSKKYRAYHIPDSLLTVEEGCLKFCCFFMRFFLPAELCLSMGSEMTFRRWHKAQRFSDRF